MVPPRLRDRMRRGTILNVLGSGFGQGSTLIINIVVARMLGLEAFGQYALIQSTLLAVAFVAQMGTGITATRYVAEFRLTDPSRAGRIVGLCALATIVSSGVAFLTLFLGADWISRVAMREPSLALALRIGAALVIFNCLNFSQMGALSGFENYSSLARIGLVSGCIALCTSVLATLAFGLIGAVISLVLTALVRWSLCQYALNRDLRRYEIVVDYQGAWAERAILWNFTLPAGLSSILTTPAIWLANLCLIQQPNGFNQNALYNAALNLKTAVMFLINNINAVGMTLLSNHKGPNDRQQFRRLYFANIALSTALMFITSGAMLLAGPNLLRLYGKNFDNAWIILCILLLVAALETVSLGVYQIIQTHDRMWASLLLIVLPVSVVLPVMSYWWVPIYGATGLAAAVATSVFVQLFMTCLVALPIARKVL